MKILVVNCGSSSLKYQLIDMETEEVMAKGYLERIGTDGSFLTHKVGGEKYKIEKKIKDHAEGMELVVEQLLHKDYGVISSLEEIENGTVLLSDVKDGLYIKAKDGIIKVLEIQGENARKMTIQEFLRGNKIKLGEIFR